MKKIKNIRKFKKSKKISRRKRIDYFFGGLLAIHVSPVPVFAEACCPCGGTYNHCIPGSYGC